MRHALHCGDRQPIKHRQKQYTRIDGFCRNLPRRIEPGDHDATRPAIALGTALFRAFQPTFKAQPIEQCRVRADVADALLNAI